MQPLLLDSTLFYGFMSTVTNPKLQDQLEELMDSVNNIQTVLPAEPDRAFWRNFIENVYL